MVFIAMTDMVPGTSQSIRLPGSTEWEARHLIGSLTRRRLAMRFRGSKLGIVWMLAAPLLMLGVFTLVFDQFLRLRWPGAEKGGSFVAALNIYLGLLLFNFLADNINSAPRLIIEHQVFVKKIVFPLPVLAYVVVFANLVLLLVGLLVVALLSASGLAPEFSPAPLLLFAVPLWLLPVVLWSLAALWLISAIGVYARDIAHLTSPTITALMFVSPVFYSIHQVSADWKPLLELNPIAWPIEQLREIMLHGNLPSAEATWVSLGVSFCAAALARYMFRKLQPGFADVL